MSLGLISHYDIASRVVLGFLYNVYSPGKKAECKSSKTITTYDTVVVFTLARIVVVGKKTSRNQTTFEGVATLSNLCVASTSLWVAHQTGAHYFVTIQ